MNIIKYAKYTFFLFHSLQVSAREVTWEFLNSDHPADVRVEILIDQMASKRWRL